MKTLTDKKVSVSTDKAARFLNIAYIAKLSHVINAF